MKQQIRILTLTTLTASLLGCGGGGGENSGNTNTVPVAKYGIAGQVTGLRDGQSLTLTLGGQELVVNRSDDFKFQQTLEAGSTYQVAIKTQPQYQTCNVKAGQGTVNAEVKNIDVQCENIEFGLGGNVQGAGENSGLVLIERNSGRSVTPGTDGTWTFGQNGVAGTTYDVVVAQNVNGKLCQVENATGILEANVNNVNVSCSTLAQLPNLKPQLEQLVKIPTPADLVEVAASQVSLPDSVQNVQIYLNGKAYPLVRKQDFSANFGEVMNDLFEQIDARTIDSLTTDLPVAKAVTALSADLTSNVSSNLVTKVDSSLLISNVSIDKIPKETIKKEFSKTPQVISKTKIELGTSKLQAINSRFASLKAIQRVPLATTKLPDSNESVDYELKILGLTQTGEPVAMTTYNLTSSNVGKWIDLSAERFKAIDLVSSIRDRFGCYENGYYRGLSYQVNGIKFLGCPSIKLTSVSPTTLQVGETKQFVLKGSDIPQYAVAELEDGNCTLPIQVNNEGTEAKVHCTANTAGTKKLTLYRALDNKARGFASQNITVTAATLPEPAPVTVNPTTKTLTANHAIAGWDANIPVGQKRPVVVFTPGWGGNTNVNASQTALNKDFVNKGYITLAIGFEHISTWNSNLHLKTTEGLQKLCADSTIPANCQAIILVGSSYGAGQNLANAIHQSDNFPNGKVLGFISQSAGYNPGWWMADNAHNNALKIADGTILKDRYLADTSKYSVGLIANTGDEVFPTSSFTSDGSNVGAGYLAQRHKAKGHSRVYSWCPSYGGHGATGNDGKWNNWVFATAKKIIHTDGGVADNTGSSTPANTPVTNACAN